MEDSENYSAVGKEPALLHPRTLRKKIKHSVMIVTPELGWRQADPPLSSVQPTYCTW